MNSLIANWFLKLKCQLVFILVETLRKYPIVPFLDRRCSKRYQIPGTDLVLDKGESVFIPIMGIQNDPKYFPNPERFDPDRFKHENSSKRNTMTFLPFGDGPRNCIGEWKVRFYRSDNIEEDIPINLDMTKILNLHKINHNFLIYRSTLCSTEC